MAILYTEGNIGEGGLYAYIHLVAVCGDDIHHVYRPMLTPPAAYPAKQSLRFLSSPG